MQVSGKNGEIEDLKLKFFSISLVYYLLITCNL